MCRFPLLSALFDYLGWQSSDVPSQPLSQELQGRNLAGEYPRYQKIELMPPLRKAAIRDRIHLHHDFAQSFNNQLMYQSFGSMQQLPQPSAVRVKQEFTSTDGPRNNRIRVGHMTYTGNLKDSYFANGTFLTLYV
ncbi:hypothetical protein EYB25_009390 [Talaromyces marneffei]|nr:hypothetical protein EYB25_009390 [Talaromyces marneffei]